MVCDVVSERKKGVSAAHLMSISCVQAERGWLTSDRYAEAMSSGSSCSVSTKPEETRDPHLALNRGFDRALRGNDSVNDDQGDMDTLRAKLSR